MWPWVVAAAVAVAGLGTVITIALTRDTAPAPVAGDQPAPASASPEFSLPTFSIPPSLGACDQLAGIPTMDVVEVGLCDQPDGRQEVLISASQLCRDGRLLYWNTTGWGWDHDVWQAHAQPDGQLVPPDAEMAACQ